MKRVFLLVLAGLLLYTTSSAQIPALPRVPVKVVSNLSLTNLDPASVHAVARAKILARLAAAKPVKMNVQAFVGPSVPKRIASQRLAQLKTAMAFWSDQYVPKTYKFVMFGYDDAAFAKKTVVEQGIHDGSHLDDSFLDTTPEFCSFGNAGNPTSFYVCIPTKRDYEENQTVSHEYTHNVNFGLIEGKSYVDRFPCWLVEGFGSFYGMELGFTEPALTSYRQGMERGMARRFEREGGSELNKSVADILKNGSDKEVLEMIDMVEVPNNYACSDVGAMAYLYGGAVIETTVALWGVDAIPKYFKNYDPALGWKTNWKKEFGVTPEQFHKAMIPYFRSFAKHLE